MTSLPPISQLAGNHGSLFESYWSQLDTNRNGRVDAASAALFLKKSQLREPILHKIWDLSDPNGKGYLDKQGFFLALRLVAACQSGKDPSVGSIVLADPPPRLVGIDSSTLASLTQNKWTIEPDERSRFEGVFQTLKPVGGLLTGEKVKPVMLASKLPVDALGKIWNLSDIDRDGKLDIDEFSVAMRLITLCQAGEILPATLPSSLVPASKAAKPSGVLSSTTVPLQPSSSAPLPRSRSPQTTSASTLPTQKTAVPQTTEWVITPEIKAKYDRYFEGIDKDHDGIVSGEEARGLLMASNLQQPILAHIWSLCDVQKNGKLNAEQFALAMYLVAEKVRGKDPPKELTPIMIPPSLRKQPQPSQPSQPSQTSQPSQPSTFTSTPPLLPTPVSATQLTTTSVTTSDMPAAGGSDYSAIVELDSITSEIDMIQKEKGRVQEDIKQKQELIQQRKGEIELLQSEVGLFTKQREELEREKLEVQAKLDQLDSEKAKFEGQIAELKQKCREEEEEIAHQKQQLSQQETSKRAQMEEIASLREQLESLQRDEKDYKKKVEASRAELEKLQKTSQTIQNDITMTRHKLDSLKEEHQTLGTTLTMYPPGSTPGSTPSSSVVNINDVVHLSGDLHAPHLAEQDAISARATAGSSSPVSSISGFSTNSHLEDGGEEGGREDKQRSDPFASTSTSSTDPFAAFSVPIGDSFASSGAMFSGKPSDLSAFDPFGPSDPFKSTSSQPGISEDLFKNDPFGTPTAVAPGGSPAHPSTASSSAVTDPFSGQDPFTSDPFSTKGANQGSDWTGANPLVDPFSQQTAHTPTDPFASGDPFTDDPFGSKSPDSNPFTAMSSSSAFSGGASKSAQQWSIQDPLPRARTGAIDREQVAWGKQESEREVVTRRQREENDLARALRESRQNS